MARQLDALPRRAEPVAGDRRAPRPSCSWRRRSANMSSSCRRVRGAGWRASPTRRCRKALSIIHKRYAEDLDVEELAREAGVSRTVLGERFVELIGEPPMRYCARWRMRIAANMLRDGKQNTANIAYAVGFNSEAAFNRAFKREYGEPPATWRRRDRGRGAGARREREPRELAAAAGPLLHARSDGTRLAYSVTGTGPPLVKTANWLNHIEHDWDSPLWRHWIDEFTRRPLAWSATTSAATASPTGTRPSCRSTRSSTIWTASSTASSSSSSICSAISQGAAVAIAYAVRHPERVRRLVICNGYAAGWAVARRRRRSRAARGDADPDGGRLGRGQSGLPAAVHQPSISPARRPKQMGWFNEMQRLSASPENAVRLQRVLVADRRRRAARTGAHADARSSIRARTRRCPSRKGRSWRRAIPGAAFVPLESRNHILLESEPAWRMFSEISREFLKG